MKSLRRTIILIIFLLVSVASMATGVFAWFVDYGNGASVGEFGGQLIGGDGNLEIDVENNEIYQGERIEDLIYLKDEEFNVPNFDYYGYASVMKITLTNPNEDPLSSVTARPQLYTVAAPEYLIYDGFNVGLIYVILDEHPTMTQSEYLSFKMQQFQGTPSILDAINSHNSQSYSIAGANGLKTFYIYVWGSYDNLSETQKNYYHALVYRIKVAF